MNRRILLRRSGRRAALLLSLALVFAGPVEAGAVKYQASGKPTVTDRIGYMTLGRRMSLEIVATMTSPGVCYGGVTIRNHGTYLFDHSGATSQQRVDVIHRLGPGRYKVRIGFGCESWDVKIIKT